MNSVVQRGTRKQAKPVSGVVRLWVQINENIYAVTPLRPHPEVAVSAFRLRKLDGNVIHDVAMTEHGPTCSCPDWIYRRDGKDPKGCKHIAALKAAGLFGDPR